jgi:hypothetical protein
MQESSLGGITSVDATTTGVAHLLVCGELFQQESAGFPPDDAHFKKVELKDPSPKGVCTLKDDDQYEAGPEMDRLHPPEEIAERLGGISVKSLGELIRKSGLETTTLGHTEPSLKGGRRRRIWGMTPAQLTALLEFRRRRAHGR